MTTESGKPREFRESWEQLRQSQQRYGRMLAYVRPYWPYLAVAAISLVIVSLLNLAMPWAVARLVDLVALGQDIALLNRIALLLAGIFALRVVFGFVRTYSVAWVGEQVVASLRREVYDHLLSLSLGYLAGQRVGEILSRISSDVQVIQTAVTGNLVILAQQVVTVIGILVIVTVMDWRLTTLMMVVLPGVVLVTRLMGRRIRDASRVVQDKLAEASAVVEETIGGIRTVQSFAREEYESQRFGQKIGDLFDTAMYRARVYATLGPLISFLMYGSLALVLWAGGQAVLRGQLTPGQLIAFLLYAAMLAGPLGGFAALFGRTQEALGATERVFELLDTRPEVVEEPDARPLPPIRGHVRFHEVSFCYDPRQPVLHHVQIEAKPGQIMALVGPSGVGKTTMVNLIPRFYDPTSGSITVDGHDVRQVTLHSLRDQIGLVPQEPLLFSDSVAANIRYGKLDASQDEIEAAAIAANAHDFIVDNLPEGYQTQVGERGVRLSGGQRQRIAIARAILKDPRILILDEATSSLDTESEQLVQEALGRLMRPGEGESGRTTFVIAHRLSTIIGADCIVVLRHGQVVEQGTHEELLAQQDSLYHHYYALQFQWEESDPLGPTEEPTHPAPEGTDWKDSSTSPERQLITSELPPIFPEQRETGPTA